MARTDYTHDTLVLSDLLRKDVSFTGVANQTYKRGTLVVSDGAGGYGLKSANLTEPCTAVLNKDLEMGSATKVVVEVIVSGRLRQEAVEKINNIKADDVANTGATPARTYYEELKDQQILLVSVGDLWK